MRADICNPDDEIAVERFKDVLKQLGATLNAKSWGLGVDVLHLQINNSELTVFSDAWSIDIEGSEELVGQILVLLNQKQA
jgi:hypothetical protein